MSDDAVLSIEPKQLSGKPRKIGKVGTANIWETKTKGGLHMILKDGGGKPETLGTGPHPGVARYIAEQHEPKIQWTTLEKADYLEPQYFQHLLPEYQELTDRIRSMQGF